MSNVVAFTGGKRCADCEEQISPKRLAAKPDARLCTPCQQERDMTLAKAVNMAHSGGRESVRTKRSTITIEW